MFAVVVGAIGVAIAVAALMFQKRRAERDARERRQRAERAHADDVTLEERAKARLAELEQTGIHPINLDELRKRSSNDRS